MEAVQAQVLEHYRSELVDRIRATGLVLSAGGLTVKLAQEFDRWDTDRSGSVNSTEFKKFMEKPS